MDFEGYCKAVRENDLPKFNDKIITKVTFWIKNRKKIWMKTIEKLDDPLQPGKKITETCNISKKGNKITLEYKEQMMVKNGVLVKRSDYKSSHS